jgi:hypothetical protein
MKRIPLLITGSLLLLLASAATALRIDVLPVPASVGLLQSIDLTLQVSGLDADQQIVSSYDVLLTFDPSLMQATAVTFGPGLGGPIDSSPLSDLSTPGQVEVSEASFLTDTELDALQGDTVILAVLSFVGTGLGTSSVQIASSLLTGTVDPQNPLFPTTLDPDVGGTRVVVQPAPIPEPGVLLLLVVGAATLLQALRIHRR